MRTAFHPSKPGGFTLVELLVVLGITTLLAGLILAAFGTARGRGRQTACLSNLRQLGTATSMYMQDNDGFYPHAVDDIDRLHPELWGDHPTFAAEIPSMATLPHVLAPYTGSREVFHCPSDIGFAFSDIAEVPVNATPTSFQAFGTSYYYRTEMAAERYSESQIDRASQINLIFDGAGNWHGTAIPERKRYNVLFADMHAKNISKEQLDEAWTVRPVPAGG